MHQHVSFVSWNVSSLRRTLGLVPRSKLARGPSVTEMHQALGSPAVLCLQEVGIRPRDGDEVAALEAALPGFVCHHALCDDAQNAGHRAGRAYGVATYVRHELASAALPTPSLDREGRVVLVALPAYGWIVGNVYAVNGSDKPYFDHASGSIDGDRHAFKRRFISALATHLQPLRNAAQLVLLGDWNVSRAAVDTHPRLRTEPPHALARAQFNETFLPDLDLVDIYRQQNPTQRAYTWFNRMAPPHKLDAARVDFALISRGLVAHVVEASVEDQPALRFHSDHAPVRLVLRTAGRR